MGNKKESFWDRRKFLCGYRIAQWGNTPFGVIPYNQDDEAVALRKLLEGQSVAVMAVLTEGASQFHRGAGYTHLLTVDHLGPEIPGGSSWSVLRTDYWLAKLIDVK